MPSDGLSDPSLEEPARAPSHLGLCTMQANAGCGGLASDKQQPAVSPQPSAAPAERAGEPQQPQLKRTVRLQGSACVSLGPSTLILTATLRSQTNFKKSTL